MTKNLLNKILLLILVATLISVPGISQKRKADRDTREWRYEIEAVRTGVTGTYLIKVWSYSKSPDVAIEQAKKNAIHGIIFRGFAGKAGVEGKPPLVSSPDLEIEKADFFDPFFDDGGKFMKFVSLTNDGAVAAEDRFRIGKEFKIGVLISVNVGELRKDLEAAGIIRALNAGF
jgi:hypothetical protein